MNRIANVSFDEERCLRHRACSVAPHVFGEESDDHPVIPDNLFDFLVADRAPIIDAVLSCPVGAITLEFEDGKELSSSDYRPERGVEQWLRY